MKRALISREDDPERAVRAALAIRDTLAGTGEAELRVAVTTGEVSAHATLESSDPANGSMLAAPPDHVELVFSENVGKPAALAVLDVMEAEDAPGRAARAGERLVGALRALPGVADARGLGLLIAAELSPGLDAADVSARCLANGLVVNAVTPTALRLAPPLLVSDGEIDEAVEILGRVLATPGAVA